MKPALRFPRHDGIYRSDGGHNALKPGVAAPPPVGRRSCPGKGRDGRNAPCSSASSAMSSGRLFLDRVARQQCPSPLIAIPDIIFRFVLKGVWKVCTAKTGTPAFLRSKHLIRRMLERASRCYELSPPALEAL
jgi:hypothetical protein